MINSSKNAKQHANYLHHSTGRGPADRRRFDAALPDGAWHTFTLNGGHLIGGMGEPGTAGFGRCPLARTLRTRAVRPS